MQNVDYAKSHRSVFEKNCHVPASSASGYYIISIRFKSAKKLHKIRGYVTQYNRIEKDVRKLRNLVKKLPRNPTPEEIHRLRTRVRRFEV